MLRNKENLSATAPGIDIPIISLHSQGRYFIIRKKAPPSIIHLSINEAEHYCALDLSSSRLGRETQRRVAKLLAAHFKKGNTESPADPRTAKIYDTLYDALSEPDEKLSKEQVTKNIAELNAPDFKRTQPDIHIPINPLKPRERYLTHKKENTPLTYFSINEAEHFCSLDLSSNRLARETQRQVAKLLTTHFKKSSIEGPADPQKTEIYSVLSDEKLSKEQVTKKIAALNAWNFKKTQSGIHIPMISLNPWGRYFIRKRENTPLICLSIYEAERYCALDLSSNRLARETQRHVAKLLAAHFRKGSTEDPADPRKAEIYDTLSNEKLPKEQVTKKIAELNAWNFKRTQSWYALLGWFTSVRLFLSRANRVGQLLGKYLKTKLFAIGGFSAGIELAIDISIILKHIFKPDEGEKEISWYKRVSNSLLKDYRWYRMVNAAVWIALNIATFILTGGISAILTICGFSFDPINEMMIAWNEIHKNKTLLKKFDAHLTLLDKQLSSIAPNHFTQYKQCLSQKETLEKDLTALTYRINNERDRLIQQRLREQKNDLDDQIQEKNFELNSLIRNIQHLDTHHLLDEYIKTQLEKSKQEATINNLMKQRIHTVCVVLGVLAGMVLFLFPPAGIPAIVGATMAFFIGSILGGFGRRIYNQGNNIKNFFSNITNKIKSCFYSQPVEPQISIESKPLIDHPQQSHAKSETKIRRAISSPNFGRMSFSNKSKLHTVSLPSIKEDCKSPSALPRSLFSTPISDDNQSLPPTSPAHFRFKETPLANPYMPSSST